MIDAVVLRLSQEMISALLEHNQDAGIVEALDSCHQDEDTGEVYLYVESEMAAAWCESWFSESELNAFISTDGHMHHFANELRRDPLIRDFQDAVLKIYRLTVSV